MAAEISEKLERVHSLAEARRIIREIYFNFDALSDTELEERLNTVQSSVQLIRAQVQKRKAKNAPAPPTPQG